MHNHEYNLSYNRRPRGLLPSIFLRESLARGSTCAYAPDGRLCMLIAGLCALAHYQLYWLRSLNNTRPFGRINMA